MTKFKFKHFLKSRNVMVFLSFITIALGGLGVWTANQVSMTQNRSFSPINTEAAGCNLSFTIVKPTLTPTSIPTLTPTITLTPTPTPPSCENSPADIVLALDKSGSMNFPFNTKSKIQWEKEAANAFVDMIQSMPANVQANVRIGVVGWSGNNHRIVTKSLTNDWASVKSFINSSVSYIDSDKYTCIECAVNGAKLLLAGSPTVNRKAVILMSDGIGNRIVSSCTDASQNSENCPNPVPPVCTYNSEMGLHCPLADTKAVDLSTVEKSGGKMFHVVGYGSGQGIIESTLTGIANDPDSDFYHYGGDPTNWDNVFANIAPEICNETSDAARAYSR